MVAVLLSKDGIGELPIPELLPMIRLPVRSEFDCWLDKVPSTLEWHTYREFWLMAPLSVIGESSMVFYEERHGNH